MRLSSKFMRTQIAMIKSISNGFSLERLRKWQDRIGGFISSKNKKRVEISRSGVGELAISVIAPRDETSANAILYIHGGGYATGGAPYAEGFGSTLADRLGCRVFAPVYRLAPENPFPGAPEDVYKAYKFVISQGYAPDKIILCGESAGGGLCYSLCLILKEKGEALPAGIIAISPWTDLSLGGESYTKNAKRDPSLTTQRLDFYRRKYLLGGAEGVEGENEEEIAKELIENPLVSPIYASLSDMPPSIIFVGGDEIMLDDARGLHAKLEAQGSRSRIIIEKGMWHAYPLYSGRESEHFFKEASAFLRVIAPNVKKLRWMALDNSAKIYPAARKRNWSNLFRLSMTLNEKIDTECLKNALDITTRRFPSMAVRLKAGMFWYYIEEIPHAPEIMDEKSFPLSRMAFDDVRKCAFRIIVYENRIAMEFFHALTDGNGGIVFLKTLVAEYLKIKHGIGIPTENGVLNTLEEPKASELEDSFMKIESKVQAKRSDSVAYKLTGTPELDGFRTNTTFIFDSAELMAKAKERGVTLTAYLSACLAKACLDMQAREVKRVRRRKPVKILIPVNLRGIYNSETLRNFVFYVCPGVDARLGDYDVAELCRLFACQIGLMVNEKQLSSRISTNVKSEKTMILKLAPLFLKNIVMKLIFNAVGKRNACFTFSNMGVVRLPEAMAEYVDRVEVLLGVHSHSPYNTAFVTYKDKSYLNIIRSIKEPKLENALYEVLKSENIKPCVEGNNR